MIIKVWKRETEGIELPNQESIWKHKEKENNMFFEILEANANK